MKKIHSKLIAILTLLAILFSLSLSASATTTITIETDNDFSATYFNQNYYAEGYRNVSGDKTDYYTWYRVYPEMMDEVIKLAASSNGVAILMGFQSDSLTNKTVQFVTSNEISSKADFSRRNKVLWLTESVNHFNGTYVRSSSLYYRTTYTNLLFTNQSRNENCNFFVTRNVLPSFILHADTTNNTTSFYLEGIGKNGSKGYVNLYDEDEGLFNAISYKTSSKQAFSIETVDSTATTPKYVIYGDVSTNDEIYQARYADDEKTYILKNSTHKSNAIEALSFAIQDADALGGFTSINYLDFNTSNSTLKSLSSALVSGSQEAILYNMDVDKIEKHSGFWGTGGTTDSFCQTFYMWVGVKGVLNEFLLDRAGDHVTHGDSVKDSDDNTTRYIDPNYKGSSSTLGVSATTTTISSDVTVKTPTGDSSKTESVYSVPKGSIVYVPTDKKITVEEGAYLIVSGGSTLILHGTIENYGTLIVQKGGQIITLQQEDNMKSAIYNINGGSTVILDGGLVAVRRFAAGVNKGNYKLGTADNAVFYKALDSTDRESTVIVNGFLSAFVELALIDGTEVSIDGGKIVYGDLQDSIYPYILSLDANDIIDKDFTSKILIGPRTNTLNGEDKTLKTRVYVNNITKTVANSGEIITSKK